MKQKTEILRFPRGNGQKREGVKEEQKLRFSGFQVETKKQGGRNRKNRGFQIS